ncbi:MAG: c-type cytochrome [Acidobacteriota bacterium]|nr:MAG: c-type cytochrome [Acidobacteriota bacterium]
MSYTRKQSSIVRAFCATGLIGLMTFISIACKSGESVVSETAEDRKAPVAQSSAGPSPTTPVGPVGQVSPTATPAENEAQSAPGDEQKGTLIGGPGITRTKARPAPTPTPDPFPPQPTPAIVMKDGKIVQQWQAPAEAAAVVNPYKNKPDAVQLGRMYYNQKCVDCHGKTGQGNGWMSRGLLRPPTNLASKVVQANTDGELFWKITKGKSPMPAHGIRFDDEQRWHIVTYLRTFKP